MLGRYTTWDLSNGLPCECSCANYFSFESLNLTGEFPQKVTSVIPLEHNRVLYGDDDVASVSV